MHYIFIKYNVKNKINNLNKKTTLIIENLFYKF